MRVEPIDREDHEAPVGVARFIEVGPFGVHFTNINSEMGLGGHSHYGEVTLIFKTHGSVGFPVFDSTTQPLLEELAAITGKPFRDFTNEKIADYLFAHFDRPDYAGTDQWEGFYQLEELRLDVQGVLDRVGHSPSRTRYVVRRFP